MTHPDALRRISAKPHIDQHEGSAGGQSLVSGIRRAR